MNMKNYINMYSTKEETAIYIKKTRQEKSPSAIQPMQSNQKTHVRKKKAGFGRDI